MDQATTSSTKQSRLYHEVVKGIIARINEGEYSPGSRLPPERALAEEFDVSRVTLREALVSLQTLGHIEVRKRSGVYVANGRNLDSDVLVEISAFELTQARLMFEPEAAALAAPTIDSRTLDQLAALVKTLDKSTSEQAGDLADQDFHLTIARSADNVVVFRVIEWLWKLRMENEDIKQVYSKVCSHDTSKRGKEHSAVLDALRAHDPDQSRIAMRHHFRRLLESMLKVTEEHELELVKRKANETRQRYLRGIS